VFDHVRYCFADGEYEVISLFIARPRTGGPLTDSAADYCNRVRFRAKQESEVSDGSGLQPNHEQRYVITA
jgi:hypothetical protein